VIEQFHQTNIKTPFAPCLRASNYILPALYNIYKIKNQANTSSAHVFGFDIENLCERYFNFKN